LEKQKIEKELSEKNLKIDESLIEISSFREKESDFQKKTEKLVIDMSKVHRDLKETQKGKDEYENQLKLKQKEVVGLDGLILAKEQMIQEQNSVIFNLREEVKNFDMKLEETKKTFSKDL